MPVTPAWANEPLGQAVQAKLYMPVLFNAFAYPNDTNVHDPTTDAAIKAAICLFHTGKRLLYYDSTLNQAITLQLMASYDGTNFFTVGSTQNVAAGNVTEQRGFIDATALAQLANPYPYIGVQAHAGTGPSAGTLTVVLIAASV